MNRRQANREAKNIFMAYGNATDFADLQELNDWTDQETDLVQDYHRRCADRVADWLNV